MAHSSFLASILCMLCMLLTSSTCLATCTVFWNGTLPGTSNNSSITLPNTFTTNLTSLSVIISGTEASRFSKVNYVVTTGTNFGVNVTGVVFGSPVDIQTTLNTSTDNHAATIMVNVNAVSKFPPGVSSSTSSSAGILAASSHALMATAVAASIVTNHHPMAATAIMGSVLLGAQVIAGAETCPPSNITVTVTLPNGWQSITMANNAGLMFVQTSAPTTMAPTPATKSPTFNDYGYNYYTVFGTALTYAGNIGTRAAADTICKNEAYITQYCCEDAIAILSYDSTDKVSNFPSIYKLDPSHSIVGQHLSNTYILANNWASFMSGPLLQSYQTNSAVFSSFTQFWTGTTTSGGNDASTCTGWSSTTGNGMTGSTTTTAYFSVGGSSTCTNSYKFTCLGIACAGYLTC
jgi:hypothetical protein